jgi:hypothetical protein
MARKDSQILLNLSEAESQNRDHEGEQLLSEALGEEVDSPMNDAEVTAEAEKSKQTLEPSSGVLTI